jgi:serine phosphatase RsbU (regulator of sigma subunit)
MKRLLIIAIVFNLSLSIYSQNFLDTLQHKLGDAGNDSTKIELYFKLISKKSIAQSIKDSLLKVVDNHFNKDCFSKCFILYKNGQVCESKNSSDEAVKLYLLSTKESENCNNYAGVARAKCRLGFINNRQKNYQAAIEYLHSSIFYSQKCNDVYDLSEAFTILGTLYKNTDVIDSALFYHNKALDIRSKLGNKKLLSLTYNNIGLVYKKKKEYRKALGFINKAYDLVIELKDNRGTATLNNNKANVLRLLNKPAEAIKCALMARDTAFKFKTSDNYLNSLTTLAEAYEANGDYKNATETYKGHIKALDSIKVSEINAEYQDLQAKYESDKKDTELAKKEQNLKLAESENSRKNTILIFSLIALVLASVAALFILRSYKLSKKNAIQLAGKNKIISEKNKEITDSINYAKNIQQSLLTSEKIFNENTKDHFIYYQPKDIVSGDFYWAHKNESGFFVVCADCTGHGVPGAFMSLLGISYLNEVIGNHEIRQPDLILNELRNKVISGFSMSGNNDGMDLSLICIEGNTLRASAANNPVWIIRKKVNLVINADKSPIGKHHGEIKDFNRTLLSLEPGDLIIQFTDGFADQFGGAKGKKFKYGHLEKLLIEHSEKNLDEIYNILKENLTIWKGDHEQVDDILIMGIRI